MGFTPKCFFFALMNFEKIYFILSQPRSGSTLLRLQLNKEPNVISIPETHFFNFKNKFKHLDPAKDPQQAIETWLTYFFVRRMELDLDLLRKDLNEGPLTWKKMFESTLLHYAKKYHPEIIDPIWVEKTPPHIFFKDDIRRMYPEARFIFLVRDPRAVVASTQNMSFSTTNVVTLSRSWQKSIQYLEENERSLLIRYEDLVETPETILKKVYEFMELSGDPDPTKGVVDPVEKKNWNSSETAKPIHSDNIEKWRRNLSRIDGHPQIVEKICAEGMKRFGYQPRNAPKHNGYYATLWASWLQFLFLKLLNLVRRNIPIQS